MADIYGLLKKYYGYDRFRPGQENIIRNILCGRDVCAIMPTGAGKSVCYQIPAIAMNGITLVISPLISLMQDQVRILKAAGIPAAYINSSLTPSMIELALSRAAKGAYKIIYVAPERLESGRFIAFAKNANISLIAVDEAHCISVWGQEFRPGYQRIADFYSMLSHRPVIAAFTATANMRVKKDIEEKLRLISPYNICSGFDRPNLYFGTYSPVGESENGIGTDTKNSFIIDYITHHKNESGIIYCMTQKLTETVANTIREAGFSAEAYHAGMSTEVRRRIQEDFTFDRTKIIAATSAFGMGIDKPDVRYVIHYNMPPRLEDYYQQAGRAGRDGVKAECILLYSYSDYRFIRDYFILRNNDVETAEDTRYFMNIKQKEEHIAAELDGLNQMKYYSASGGMCLRKRLLGYFGEILNRPCGNCSVCLKDTDIRRRGGFGSKPDEIKYDEVLFARLKARVKIIAVQSGIPTYSIVNDPVLKTLAAEKPATIEELSKTAGLGTVKIRKYGDALLEVINTYKDEGVEQSEGRNKTDTY